MTLQIMSDRIKQRERIRDSAAPWGHQQWWEIHHHHYKGEVRGGKLRQRELCQESRLTRRSCDLQLKEAVSP